MTVDEEFNIACVNIKNLSKKPSELELLKLYGLYKQSIVGSNNEPKPSIFNMRDMRKWTAWYDNRMLSKNMAKKKYIELYNDLKLKYD